MGWTVWGSNPGMCGFCSLKMSTPLSGKNPASCLTDTGVIFLAGSGKGMELTAILHPVLRFRISGAIPRLPLCFSIAATGKTTFYSKEPSLLLHVSRPQLARIDKNGKSLGQKPLMKNWNTFQAQHAFSVSCLFRSKPTKGTRCTNCYPERPCHDSVNIRTASSIVSVSLHNADTNLWNKSIVQFPTRGKSDNSAHYPQKLLPLVGPKPL